MATFNNIASGGLTVGGLAIEQKINRPFVSLESAVYRFLNAQASVTDLVGTNIWKFRLPQSFDWSGVGISFWKVSETHDHSLSGGSGMARARVQIDVWSGTSQRVDEVTEAIRLLLSGFAGQFCDEVEATSVQLDNVVTLPEPPENGTDEWRFHIASDYLINYREAKPQI